MPRLACYACGRTLWSAAPLEDLFAGQRRCPRCGASLRDDRRGDDRRGVSRRQDSSSVPVAGERRLGDRRVAERRRSV